MNLSQRSVIIAMATAMTLIGCDQNRHNPDTNPDNQVAGQKLRTRSTDSSADQDQRAEDQTVATPILVSVPEQEPTTEGQPTEGQPSDDRRAEEPAATEPTRSKQTRTARGDDDRQPMRQESAPRRGLLGASKAAVLGTGAAVSYYTSEMYHAWRPTKDTMGRRDALEAMHDRRSEARTVAPSDLANLKSQIAQSSPDEERIRSIVTSDSETNRLLVNVLTERNPDVVAGASERLVSEIFNVADEADEKVQKIQLSLRALAKNDAYDAAAANRVTYLQTELDKRIHSDNLQSSLKRGSFLVMTAAAAAAFGGYNGVERVGHAIDKIPVRRGLAAAEEGVEKAKSPRFWTRWGRKASDTTSEGVDAATAATAAAGGRIKRTFKKLGSAIRAPFVVRPLRPVALAKKDIQDVLNEIAKGDTAFDALATMKKLNFKRTPAKFLPERAQRVEGEIFAPSQKPGLNFAVTDRLGGLKQKDPEGTYRVVAEVIRPKSTHYLVSEPLPSQEANDLVAKVISQKMPSREFKVVHADSGLPASAAEAEVVGGALNGGEMAKVTPQGTVVIEGQAGAVDLPSTAETADIIKAEKLIEASAAGLKPVVTRASEKAADAVEATQAFGKRSLARIKGDQKFSPGKAVVTGTLAGVPAYLFSRSAYFQGRRTGEGFDALYLEDLIPSDRLQRVIVPIDGE